MATYLVGEQRNTFFSSNKNWNLEDAIEAAQDGDTIEIEDGFRGNYETVVTVNKSITIQGHFQENQDGTKNFSTVLNVHLDITDGASVTLQDVWISQDTEKKNCIFLNKESSLNCNNVQFENSAVSGQNYPIIFAEGNSHLLLNTVNIHATKIHDGNHQIYIKNSFIKIVNSLINARIYLNENSEMNCNQVTVNNADSNALFLNKSKAIINDTAFSGGKVDEKDSWMCVKANKSTLEATDVSVQQENVSSALYMVSSNIKLIRAKVSSVCLDNTTANFDDTTITDSALVLNKSELNANRIDILGHDNGRINLYADRKSTITADQINFGHISNPNIKLDRTVQINVPELNLNKYNEKTGYFDTDEDNCLIFLEQSKIVYFGEDNSAEKKLQDLIGIQDVKTKVAEFVAVAQMNKKRSEKGLSSSAFTLHSLYLGNPGTGKTTVARIVGELLYEKKVIVSNKLIEVSRSDLVGQYIGDTALKTEEVLKSALGGVLFIDEAYTLVGEEKDFGRESINEILKFMEDHRDDIVIIFAGYTDEMQKFLEMNEGLKSRIPNTFNFKDYSIDEIVKIGLLQLTKQKYKVDHDAYVKLVKHNFKLSNDHSNGRWIRNLNEQIQMKMALRLSKDENADLSEITVDDLNAVEL